MQSMEKYSIMLEKKRKEVRKHQTSLQVARSPFTNATILTVLVKGAGPVTPRYSKLLTDLLNRDAYEPIFLNDIFEDDISRDFRYRYVSDLVDKGLPGISFEILKYTPGGSWQTLVFVWKIDGECDREKSDKLAGTPRQEMPTFHTRAMKDVFKNRFNNIAKITPSVRRAIYRFLTDDNSSSENTISKAVDARLHIAINSEDPELTVDLRALNKGRPEKFDAFWNALGAYLDESIATQERRHGDVGYMPVAISVRDLISKVSEKLPEGTPIPSETWVRFQFWPKDPSARSATQYTGRFNVRYHVQTRQIRQTHPDVSLLCSYMAKYLR